VIKNTKALLEFWEKQMRRSHRSSNYFFRKSPSHYHMMLLVMSAYKHKKNISVEELKTKEDDFIGKDALIKRKTSPQKKLVGLELIGKEQAINGDCVHVGKAQVGVITSGMISPTLNKNIALCRMDIKYSEVGTSVEVGKIDGHQKRIGAKVVKFPFYDPEKSRVRA